MEDFSRDSFAGLMVGDQTDDALVVKTERFSQVNKPFFQQAHKLVFSQLSMSPVEHDIFALLLNRLDKDHWQLNEIEDFGNVKSPHYSFNTDVLSEWLKIPKRDLYNVIKEPTYRLMQKHIGIIDDTTQRYVFRPLFKEIRYDSGTLTIIPNDRLMPEYLCLSQGHSQIFNDTFRSLKTDYSKRLYSALCRFKEPGSGTLHPRTIADWHAFFGLLDQSGKLLKKSFSQASAFVDRIIKPSVKEIVEKEPRIKFMVDEKTGNHGWAYKKDGRKITHIEFLFQWTRPGDAAKQEKIIRDGLCAEQSDFEIAKFVWELVNQFVVGEGGGPSIDELNVLMKQVPELMGAGYLLDGAFMVKFSVAMDAAKNAEKKQK